MRFAAEQGAEKTLFKIRWLAENRGGRYLMRYVPETEIAKEKTGGTGKAVVIWLMILFLLPWSMGYAGGEAGEADGSEPMILPVGTYLVGQDLPQGCYLFNRAKGERCSPVCFLYSSEDTARKKNLFAGRTNGYGAAEVLENGQILFITCASAEIREYRFGGTDPGPILPTGRYLVGRNIPAGTYRFRQISGDEYAPVFQLYDAENPEHTRNLMKLSLRGEVERTLTDDQELIITWTAVETEAVGEGSI